MIAMKLKAAYDAAKAKKRNVSHLLVGVFTFSSGGREETGPVYIAKRHIPRSKYAAGLPKQAKP